MEVRQMKTILLIGSPSLGNYSFTDILMNKKAVEIDDPMETIKIKINPKENLRVIECVGLTEYLNDFDTVYNKAEDAVEWREGSLKEEEYANFNPNKLQTNNYDVEHSSDNENTGFDALIFVIQYGTRFTKQDVEAKKIIKTLFGEDIFRDLGIILFAAFGNTVAEQSFKDYIGNVQGDLKMFLEEVDNRCDVYEICTDEEVKPQSPDKDKSELNRLKSNDATPDTIKQQNPGDVIHFVEKFHLGKRFTKKEFLKTALLNFDMHIGKRVSLFQANFDNFILYVRDVSKETAPEFENKHYEAVKTTFEQIKSKGNYEHYYKLLKTFMTKIENSVKSMKYELSKIQLTEPSDISEVLKYLQEECEEFKKKERKPKTSSDSKTQIA